MYNNILELFFHQIKQRKKEKKKKETPKNTKRAKLHS